MAKTRKDATTKTDVGYKGNVTLEFQRNGRKIRTVRIKNTGVNRLFTGIAYFLSGRWSLYSPTAELNTINAYIPKYLGIGVEKTDSTATVAKTTFSDSLLQNELNIRRFAVSPSNPKIDTASGIVSISFQAKVPFTSIGAGNRIIEIGLFNDNPTSGTAGLLARISLEAVDLPDGSKQRGIEIAPGEDFIVNWELQLGNKA